MSLIDLFKEFHRDAIQQEFPTSARVLYDTLLYEFNAAHWLDELAFSERDLIQLTGLPKTTLHDAKHFLASRQYIKITPFKKKTAYSLCKRPVGDRCPTGRRPVGDRFEEIPIKRACKDVKTTYLPADRPTRTRACDNRELDEAVDYWHDTIGGGKLTTELQSRLGGVLTRHDLGWLKAAMEEAASANHDRRGCSPKWLFACIERLENPKPPLRVVKGGEKRERVAVSSGGESYGYGYNESELPEWA